MNKESLVKQLIESLIDDDTQSAETFLHDHINITLKEALDLPINEIEDDDNDEDEPCEKCGKCECECEKSEEE